MLGMGSPVKRVDDSQSEGLNTRVVRALQKTGSVSDHLQGVCQDGIGTGFLTADS